MTDPAIGDDLLLVVRLVALACTIQFFCFSVAAGLFFLGYLYRGWPEKIYTLLARGMLMGSAALPFVVTQANPRVSELMRNGWPWVAVILLLASFACVLNGYAYWRWYLPRLRHHPAYRGKGY